MSDREKQVRDRAYALWEAEGSPEGRHREHWEQAELELGGAAPGEGPAADDQAGGNGVSAQAPSEGAADLPAGGADSPEPSPAKAEAGVAPTAPAEGAPDLPKRRTRKKASS